MKGLIHNYSSRAALYATILLLKFNLVLMPGLPYFTLFLHCRFTAVSYTCASTLSTESILSKSYIKVF